MQANLRCRISAGQFSSECAVVVKSFNGRTYSLFVPKCDLTFTVAPTEDDSVDGWIAVEVLQKDKNRYLIRLPQTTLENGQFLTVNAEQLDRAPERLTVA